MKKNIKNLPWYLSRKAKRAGLVLTDIIISLPQIIRCVHARRNWSAENPEDKEAVYCSKKTVTDWIYSEKKCPHINLDNSAQVDRYKFEAGGLWWCLCEKCKPNT